MCPWCSSFLFGNPPPPKKTKHFQGRMKPWTHTDTNSHRQNLQKKKSGCCCWWSPRSFWSTDTHRALLITAANKTKKRTCVNRFAFFFTLNIFERVSGIWFGESIDEMASFSRRAFLFLKKQNKNDVIFCWFQSIKYVSVTRILIWRNNIESNFLLFIICLNFRFGRFFFVHFKWKYVSAHIRPTTQHYIW